MDWRFVYRGLKARYRDERAELRALAGALSPGEIAVDVGANKGSYLWSLSHAVRGGRVVAFEPQPVLADYLRRACRDSGLRNVQVEAAGVSASPGRLTLAIPGGGESSPAASFEAHAAHEASARRVEVPVLTLDDYFRDEPARVGAIKIDVEGHESAVLDGALQLIARGRPALVIECEQRHLDGLTVEAVIERVLGLGYVGCFVERGALRPIADFDRQTHQPIGEGRFWDEPGYCNNFVFLRSDRNP